MTRVSRLRVRTRLLTKLDPRLTAQCVTRPGDTLVSGSTKVPRTGRVNPQQEEGAYTKKDPSMERGRQRGVNMEDYGIFPPNDDHIRLAQVPPRRWLALVSGSLWARSSGHMIVVGFPNCTTWCFGLSGDL